MVTLTFSGSNEDAARAALRDAVLLEFPHLNYVKTGAGAPTGTTDPPGHVYLDISSYDVYQSTGEGFQKLVKEA